MNRDRAKFRVRVRRYNWDITHRAVVGWIRALFP